MNKSDNDYLNNKNPVNPKITDGEMVSIPYIICAAIWFNDGGVDYIHQNRNVETGFVVTGRRHHNCFITSFILHGKEIVEDKVRDGEWVVVQGFVTSDDRFVDRKEAGQIAFDAGQTKKLRTYLASEDLY